MNSNKIEQMIAGLRNGFDKVYEQSNDREQLLLLEIEKHELLFDNNRLPLPEELHTSRRPIKGFSYTDGDILNIREAYTKYIVYGGDIADAGQCYYVNPKDVKRNDKGEIDDDDIMVVIDNRGRIAKKFPPSDIQLHFYELAVARWEHLAYLKSLMIPTKVEREEVTTLEEACGENYGKVRKWFVSQQYCDVSTFIFNTEKYPLYWLAGLLKGLHETGLCQKLKHTEIRAIAENSFRVEMKIDTVKKAKKLAIDIH